MFGGVNPSFFLCGGRYLALGVGRFGFGGPKVEGSDGVVESVDAHCAYCTNLSDVAWTVRSRSLDGPTGHRTVRRDTGRSRIGY